uniref:Disease resistance R13L4/SHOC-2-like LRR domain-containing protein n=1 Tax=Oryza punctata TaxID=4537 RepID=A0A0E0LST1_ORYPU
MESMNSLLMQLTEAQHRNHQVRTWMKHVVRLTRDCEGNVELYVGYLRRVVRFDHPGAAPDRDVGERRQRYGVTVPAASDLNAAGAAEAPEDDMRYRYEPPEMNDDDDDKLADTLVRWLTEEQSPAATATATATTHDEDDHEPPLRVLNVIGRDPDYWRNATCILRYPFDKALQMCDHIGSGDAFAMKMFVRLVHVKPHRTEEELDMYRKAISECKRLNKSVRQQMVMFCYNELPIKYRSCLLYLTVFPKDHRIRATSLVRRWIAEGLIATSTAAGDGEKCFLDVFFTRGAAGYIKSFTLHQEVRESIARIATDVNFVEENLPPDLAHHLSIHNRIMLRGSRTVSADSDSDSKGIVALLPTLTASSQWQLLKVLRLQRVEEESSEENMQDIYLSLRSTDVTQLPRQIKHLQCLETLDIRETGVQALSKKAIVLPRISLLDNNSCEEESSCTTVRTPLGIERMKDMEILSHVLVSNSDTELAGIAQLLKLRKLGVLLRGEDVNKLLPDLLRQIKTLCSCLRSLSIRIIDQPAGGGGGGDNHDQQAVVVVDAAALTPAPEFIERLNITGLTHGLPQFIQLQLNRLTKLTLTETYLAKQGLLILANKLNCLRSLMLQQNSYTESELAFKEGEFRNLNSLLVGSSNITTIRFERGAGFWLRRIVWSFPTTAPCLFGVSHLIHLQEFELNGDCSPDQVRDALEMERHPMQRPCFRHNPQGPATCMPSSAP